ncbi:hypothetical protein [Pandoraea sp. NPDC087047]|uniref:hypothetical protein n=1 Tax=Pandoraea sp. NPDC087047 TaxID=3364390 RepID=UPI003802CB45
MKLVTRNLFRLIRRRSEMTPSELENFFGFESSEGALYTGEAWIRYERSFSPHQRREYNKAASIDRIQWITQKALAIGWVTTTEAIQIGLGKSPQALSLPEYRAAIARQNRAKQVFAVGKVRMLVGKMPVAPSAKGGAPRSARSGTESVEAFARWSEQLRSAGFEVIEDRGHLTETDALLQKSLGRHPPNAPLTQYLSTWELPFDPAFPRPAAVERLQLYLLDHDQPHEPWPVPARGVDKSRVNSGAEGARGELEIALDRLDSALGYPLSSTAETGVKTVQPASNTRKSEVKSRNEKPCKLNAVQVICT